jgi:YHS domain-containing protein
MKSMLGMMAVAVTLGFGLYGCASTGTASGQGEAAHVAGDDCGGACDKSAQATEGDCCDKSATAAKSDCGGCDKAAKADGQECDKSKGDCGGCADGATTAQAASSDMVGQKATCPVSGNEFTVAADSPSAVHEGATHYFCCGGCKGKFEANPASFLAN